MKKAISHSPTLPLKVLFVVLLSFILFLQSNAQVVSDLDNVSCKEGDAPVIIDNDVSVSGDNDYTGGFIEIAITENKSIKDQLSIINGGNIIVSGNAVFWNGNRIGNINNTNNGLNGNPLRIEFDTIAPLHNSGFETGDLSFWRVDTSMNQMNGQTWAEGPDTFGFTADIDPKLDDWIESNEDTVIAKVLNDARYTGSYGLYLAFSKKNQNVGQLSSVSASGTIHTPSIISNPFTASIGDNLTMVYNAGSAVNTDDWVDVFGFVFNDVNNNEIWDEGEDIQKLFHDIGPTTSGWIEVNEPLTIEGSDLRFWFINGSYDNSGGGKVGSYLYVDDIVLTYTNLQAITNQMVENIIERVAYQNQCGKSSNKEFGITLNDNTGEESRHKNIYYSSDPPILAPVENIEVIAEPGKCVGVVSGYPEIVATDICDITYTLIEGVGKPGEYPVGTTTEKWIATDGGGKTDTVSFNIIVHPVNSAPVIDQISNVSVNQHQKTVEIPFTGIGAQDDCGTQIVTLIEASSDNLGLVESVAVEFNPGEDNGVLLISFFAGEVGSSNIKITITDDGGVENGGANSTVEEFVVTVIDINDPPVLVGPLDDEEVTVGKTLFVDISSSIGDIFYDEDDAFVEISVLLENGRQLPPWGVYDNDILTVTPIDADTGSYNVLVKATDKGGLVAEDVFILSILSSSTGLEDIEKLVYIKMFPNPTKGKVNIELTGSYYSDIEIVVNNISGKEVFYKDFHNTNLVEFDLGDLINGLYFIKLKIEGVQVVKKLILDHN